MNADRINELLERYYDAQTTEAEELELKRFFATEEVPEHLQTEKEMFLQLQEQADISLPEGLEERLKQSIDKWDAEERNCPKLQRKVRIIRLQQIGSIAASLLLIVAFGWYMYEPQRKDTCATPEEAYAEAQRALGMFASALNKGMAHMEDMHATTERIEKTIQKQFNKINE